MVRWSLTGSITLGLAGARGAACIDDGPLAGRVELLRGDGPHDGRRESRVDRRCSRPCDGRRTRAPSPQAAPTSARWTRAAPPARRTSTTRPRSTAARPASNRAEAAA